MKASSHNKTERRGGKKDTHNGRQLIATLRQLIMTSSPVTVTWFMFTERCSTQEWHEGNHVQSRHIYWLSTVVPPSCPHPAEPSVTTISGCEKHSALYNVVPTTGNNKLDMSPDMNIKRSKELSVMCVLKPYAILRDGSYSCIEISPYYLSPNAHTQT